MYFLAGVASATAMDLISSLRQGLLQSTAGTSTGASQASPFSVANNPTSSKSSVASNASAASSPLSSSTMNALLGAQSDRSDGLPLQLFSLLDNDCDGKVSKSEFEKVFAASGNASKADAVFTKLDADGDGSVSQSELGSALKGARHQHGASGMSGMPGLGSASSDSGSRSTTKTVTRVDGSVTTTISYADGTSVSTTRLPANAETATNPLEQLIQRQAQMLSASTAGQSLAVSA